MHIEVRRKWFSDASTIGELYVDGIFQCFTLEDCVRASGIKVYGKTAIPAGMYQVTVDLSSRFNKYMPHILDVSMFDGIRIHSGNTEADTLGCILLGQDRGQDCVMMSRNAFAGFFEKLAVNVGVDDHGLAIFRVRERTDILITNEPEVDKRSAQGSNPLVT